MFNGGDLRICTECRKRPCKTPRSFFCNPCWEARRAGQLRAGQEAHKRLEEAGEAARRLLYGGQPTKWAREHKEDLVKQMEEIVTVVRALVKQA